jgi:hypothetical protein
MQGCQADHTIEALDMIFEVVLLSVTYDRSIYSLQDLRVRECACICTYMRILAQLRAVLIQRLCPCQPVRDQQAYSL